ncbi:MAG: NAD(P)H-hydrate dehydratase [Bacteroidales bacterium]|nr:NAD(P)H-hydrate dehydratase [Bacteroidales bacterium]MBN2756186.1 NAD(P)H-hydrate dehydratase [Bacteroidales bacterium]
MMKILSSEQIKKLDAYTIINEPIQSINLMERAANVCAKWIIKKFDTKHKFHVFVGPGNNGGDGLAISRLLSEKGYNVNVFVKPAKLSDDAQINYERLLNVRKAVISSINDIKRFPNIKKQDIIIDALFGSGLSRPIEGFYAELIDAINKSKAKVISIDIPSGFFSEDNSKLTKYENGGYVNAVKADYTLSLELPFLSFFFPDSQEHVGDLKCLPIGLSNDFLNSIETNFIYVDNNFAQKLLKKRKKFEHKGNYGHALIIAGDYGKMGAATLSAKACLKSGVGLLTVHVPVSGYEIIQTTVPEAMVCIDESGTRFCKSDEQDLYDVIGIGPGIGQKKSTLNFLYGVLNNAKKPVVLDADALNLLSKNYDLYDLIPNYSILTPHPGEFKRLVGESNSFYEQYKKQTELAKNQKVIVVLKGAYTSIATPDGKLYINSTGNPGMATAGSGDALTGVITSLLAQGYEPENAAILGVYIHGLAGDIAMKKHGLHALIASDIIDNLGKTFKTLY